MPAPIGSISTDQVVYDHICNPLAKYLCFMNPNVISVMGFLFVIPIMYNILMNRSVWELVVLMMVKAVIDCLDGAVARKCDKCTKLGATLDILFDTLSILLISATVILKIGESTHLGRPLKFIWILLLFLVPSACLHHLRCELSGDTSNRFSHRIDVWVHDNIIFCWVVFAFLIKCIV